MSILFLPPLLICSETTLVTSTFPSRIVLSEIEKNLQEISRRIIFEKAPFECVFYVEVETGSVKRIVKIGVIASVLFNFISGYGGLREGIDYLRDDFQSISSLLMEEVKGKEQFQIKEVISAGRNTGILDLLQRILAIIENIENEQNNMSPNEIQEKLKLVKEKLALLINALGEESSEILKDIPLRYKTDLPTPTQKQLDFFRRTYFILPDDRAYNKLKIIKKS